MHLLIDAIDTLTEVNSQLDGLAELMDGYSWEETEWKHFAAESLRGFRKQIAEVISSMDKAISGE